MSDQQPSLFDQPKTLNWSDPSDPCESKHQGDDCSVDNFREHVLPNIDGKRRAVYEAIHNAGEKGLTCRELSAQWGTLANPMHSLSGLFTWLINEKRGAIEKRGLRRGGGGVCHIKGDYIPRD